MNSSDFQEVAGSKTYRAWKEWEQDDFISGVFMKEGIDNYDNPQYDVKLTGSNFLDEDLIGTTFCLNSNGSLNMKMEEVEVGQEIKVSYEGTEVVQKGKYKGKDFHMVKLLAKPLQVADVAPKGDDVL